MGAASCPAWSHPGDDVSIKSIDCDERTVPLWLMEVEAKRNDARPNNLNDQDLMCDVKLWKCDVKLIRVTGLPESDWTPGKSEPVCQCEVLGSPTKQRFRTKMVDCTVTPTWNQAAEVEVLTSHAHSLRFVVYDRETGRGEDANMFGWAHLALEDFIPTGFCGKLPLKGPSAKNGEALLSIRVRVKPDYVEL
eukprot:TRINITY_DN73527_c0_g1_i1.p1 TRINITY_DN73527_c0_g1~~TRINITY_DN73527_c0_g1_i1.p1  ORF type:complete len:192 (-),score=33.75 TRINITY_DN73527_c0_g1_i1:60-635(-)